MPNSRRGFLGGLIGGASALIVGRKIDAPVTESVDIPSKTTVTDDEGCYIDFQVDPTKLLEMTVKELPRYVRIR